ncbi:BTAD domain-containing putative transcriptional regulator [Streptococcus hyovaginalis]
MVKMTFQLLGQPKIFLDNEEQFFTFAKVNALLYYLVLNGTVQREMAASLLWGNKSTQTAKKNLRNTIYQANKAMKNDVIICPNRNLLTLNPEISVESDVASFLEDPVKHLDLYQGDFLQGFYLKNCDEFDLWLSSLRVKYEQYYLEAAYQKIEAGLSLATVHDAEKHLKQLIERDEFEEKNYQLLMQLYQKEGRSSKVIETYYQLVNLLDKELGIQPNPQSQQIYQEVLAKDRNDRKVSYFLRTEHLFLGRIDEIKQLEAFFATCLTTQDVRAMLLVGDTGIGKRTLARQVLTNQMQHFQIVTLNCFREEAGDALLPWKNFLNRLEDLVIQYRLWTTSDWKQELKRLLPSDYHEKGVPGYSDHIRLIIGFIVTVLQQLAEMKPLIILIEDIHWMDTESLGILQRVLHRLAQYPVAFVLTKHLGTPPHLDECLNALTRQGKLDRVQLQPFSREESFDFIRSQLTDRRLSDDELEQLYQSSQGIPFFLAEYTQLLRRNEKFTPLTPAIKAKLGLKLANLDSLDNELLNYLSCCPKPVPLNTLAQLMTLSLEEVIAIVDNLGYFYILKESSEDDDVLVSFRQHIIHLYCYDRLSLSKKRLLHGQIASRLEALLPILSQNPQIMEEIAYHYTQSHQVLKALEYQLHYLEAILEAQHEVFPIYNRYLSSNDLILQDNQTVIEERFETIREHIRDLESHYSNHPDFQELLIRFSYLEGRYQIRIGYYQEGIKHIQTVIALANDLNQTSFLLEGYRQLIHYCIQVENKTEMKYYTELSLAAAVSANHFEAIAISLRFMGLYHLIVGQLDDAQRLLLQSIDFFRITPAVESQYAIQIAAALDYLAEIAQINQDFDKAIQYQNEAIRLTEQKSAELPASVFYIGLGITYFSLNHFNQAESCFIQAKEHLKKHLNPWRETQLQVYWAMTQWYKGNSQPTIQLLHQSEQLMTKYGNPRDRGTVFYLMAIIKYHLLKSTHQLKAADASFLSNLLREPFEHYYEVAIAHLNPYRDAHLVKELESLHHQLNTPKNQQH